MSIKFCGFEKKVKLECIKFHNIFLFFNMSICTFDLRTINNNIITDEQNQTKNSET